MTKKNKNVQQNAFQNSKGVNLNKSLPKVLMDIFKQGDIFTKLSFLIMGFSNIVRGQFIKGCIFLLSQISFIYFMFMNKGGLFMLKGLTTLGEIDAVEPTGFQPRIPGDDSRKFLLFGIITVLVCLLFILLWSESIKSGYIAEMATKNGKKPNTFFEDIKDHFDTKIHRTFLLIPLMGIFVMTIIPILDMICMAFTNFDKNHNGENERFTWTGLATFGKVLNMGNGSKYSYTFWHVLGWTIIWAIVATFSCYIGGIIIAMIINRKSIKFKTLWRTLFIMSAATPQFVTLLLMRSFLQDRGLLNGILVKLGLFSSFDTAPGWLSDPMLAKIMVLVVNLWIGIPFTIMITTGILQNIPEELYEAAKMDGANTKTIFFKITLPYMIFVTTPYLIQTFIGNINNFNVIYLLTAGKPTNMNYDNAGHTDLLVTWLYKLSLDYKEYNVASAIGILVFVITATFSLLVYRKSGSYNNEEEFQ